VIRAFAVLVWLAAGLACRGHRPALEAGRPAAFGYAYVPPQCYTKTKDAEGRVFNPCYTCHVHSRPPNFVDDGDLQLSYAFARPAATNPWSNLFVDRRAALRAISEEEVLGYIRRSNYFDPDGGITLRRTLGDRDANHNGRWDGYLPDCQFRFDDRGHDRTAGGGFTGWRAFAYHPFPGAFWPTNGSTDDVLIRLDAGYRQEAGGRFDLATYEVNLALVEALVRERDVAIDAVDERRWGVDLDNDGRLGTARRVAFLWPPRPGRAMRWVGQAGGQPLARGLFPAGTEFLHTVRYLDPDGAGGVALSARLKELRYARKTRWATYSDLEVVASREAHEKRKFPDRLHHLLADAERGVSNGQGWIYQGFIEDRAGALRPQSTTESATCVGCHGGLGATTDSAFAFARKLPDAAFRRGWFHWSQRGLSGLPEPRRADGRHEYSTYLQVAGGGDELRENQEVRARFFSPDGQLRPAALEELHQHIGRLLIPSRARALDLDRAYWLLVREQSFDRGRTPVLAPATAVHREVEVGLPTGILEPVRPLWAIAGSR
jgi:hypothetical protein